MNQLIEFVMLVTGAVVWSYLITAYIVCPFLDAFYFASERAYIVLKQDITDPKSWENSSVEIAREFSNWDKLWFVPRVFNLWFIRRLKGEC